MRKLHRWVGLFGAVFILLQSATGALLVYRWEIARWLDPAGMVRISQAENQSLGAIVAAMRDYAPDFQVKRVYFPQSAKATYLLQLIDTSGDQRLASVDGGNLQALRFGSVWLFPAEAALKLHYQLLPGNMGLAVVIITATALLTSIITGVWTWLPRRSGWRGSLAINHKAGSRLLTRQLHKTTAVLCAPLLIVVLVTGVLIATEILLAPVPTANTSAFADPEIEAVDRAVKLATTAFPSALVRDVAFLADRIKVQFYAPENSARAVHQVFVSLQGNTVDRIVTADQNPSWWIVLLPIHTGDILGRPGKWLAVGVALSLTCIAVLGLVMWIQRGVTRRRHSHVISKS